MISSRAIPSLLQWIILISVAMSSQRFLLQDYYYYACLVPFFAALVIFFSAPIARDTLLLVALISMADYGGEVYKTTPDVIRLGIYFSVFIALTSRITLSDKRIVLWLIALSIPLLLTLTSLEHFSFGTFRNDILVAVLVGLVLCQSRKSIARKDIDVEFFSSALTVYLFGEIANILLFFVKADGFYLNYNSTKSFVVFPAIYCLIQGNLRKALVYIPITLVVLVAYGTRMIAVMFFVVLLISLFSQATSRSRNYVLGAIFLGSALLAIDSGLIALDSNRISAAFSSVVEGGMNFDLRTLDPVRYDENQIFFSRNIVEILFGSGLGSGLPDFENLMSYVTYDQSAFSREELDTNIYHGLHDVWTDVGLRFGILMVAGIFFAVAAHLRSAKQDIFLFAAYLFLLLFCAFYSVAGLLGITLIGQTLRARLVRQNFKTLETDGREIGKQGPTGNGEVAFKMPPDGSRI